MRAPTRRLPVRFCLTLTLLAVTATGLFPPWCRAQVDPTAAFRQGTHAFRRILYDQLGGEIKPLTRRGELLEDPAHTLLIVLGETQSLPHIPGGLYKFVHQGGAVLVATDRDAFDDSLAVFGTRIVGRLVQVNQANLDRAYRGLPDCPFAEPLPTRGPPLFRNLKHVATNRPGYLLCARPSESPWPLASFPNGSQAERTINVGFMPLVFAAGGDVGSNGGRILVLADHSVFINEMLIPTDNDNFEFAGNCLEWLTDGGKRTRVLFLEEGETVTEFDIPVKDLTPPIPPPGMIIEAVNQVLRGLDEENAFNRMMTSRLEQLSPLQQRRLTQSLLVLATLMLALYGLVRLGLGRYRLEPGAPLLDVLLARQSEPMPVLAGRRQEMVRAGNFWEPARTLSRQWFEQALGPRLDTIEKRSREHRLPVLRAKVKGGLWRRWTLGRQVRHFWRLAHEDRPRRVSYRQFRRLHARLGRLRAALGNDELRFDVPEE